MNCLAKILPRRVADIKVIALNPMKAVLCEDGSDRDKLKEMHKLYKQGYRLIDQTDMTDYNPVPPRAANALFKYTLIKHYWKWGAAK